ncbi:MAG: YqgE/AlgH family protein [Alphaproteobacteria bacterium]|nr:YqgE/AlgH family protein [Alphaproteobacteria bacterium]
MPATFAVTSLPNRARRCLAAVLALLTILLVPPPGAMGRAVPNVGDGAGNLTGRLVVATENMGDPRFQNTVIYMVEHNAGGAMGLIVNVPFGAMPLARLFERLGLDAPETAAEIEVYYGGPVESERGFLLHSAEVVMEGSIVVGEGVAMTAEAEMLHKIARGEGPERSLFAFGYSGWGPRQLESEFARDDWFVIPADLSLIFAIDPARSWERAAARRSLDL